MKSDFFKFTVGKLGLTLIISILLFSLGEGICSPLEAEGGGRIYPCGEFLGKFLSFSWINLILVLLVTYTISCIILSFFNKK